MSVVAQVFRQPLVHFLLIGLGVFILFGAQNGMDATPSAQEIVITEGKIAQLVDRYRAVWRRQPTRKELEKLIDNYIRNEILTREAVALSLDSNDTVIRQRLRQKMEFLIESATGALKPSDEELRAFFNANIEKFALAPEVAFEQIFVGENPSTKTVEEVSQALKDGADPGAVGATTLLPASMKLSSKPVVDRTFGRNFFAQLASAEAGVWSGPVKSGYGVHFVRVTKLTDGTQPSFEEVRDAVVRDWKIKKSDEIAAEQYDRMRQRYSIERPDLSSLKAAQQ